jgi:hypothetical protein
MSRRSISEAVDDDDDDDAEKDLELKSIDEIEE